MTILRTCGFSSGIIRRGKKKKKAKLMKESIAKFFILQNFMLKFIVPRTKTFDC